tara:strand:- start:115 stop:1410 length:1296 start_codon:yes stop_codon:yes gene_type:complete
MSNKRLILIELNEINFDYVKEYIKNNKLPNFKAIIDNRIIETTSEEKYEELEPWVQWVSAHTGKTLAEHDVFRLGDVVNSDVKQIFEGVEAKGYKVGCISAMNASNKLNKPSYFIPDPWTLTKSDDSFWSRKLTAVIQQVVNDNAQSKVSLKSLFLLLAGILRFARFKNYPSYLKLALSVLKKPWSKAMFLDLFLHDVHWTLLQKKKPNFSTLFINAGAHIQHHYLFNAQPYENRENVKNPEWYISPDDDPLLDLLKLYDTIIGEYLNSDYDVIIATGLTQIPFTHEKYYWRIKNHSDFLKKLDINFKSVAPRMTRDFLIEFSSEQDALIAEKKLSNVKSKSGNVFLFEEIDNRKTSLFVTLTYPHKLNQEFEIINGDEQIEVKDDLAFVAIKNGMHSPKGYLYLKGSFNEPLLQETHVKVIYKLIDEYFS